MIISGLGCSRSQNSERKAAEKRQKEKASKKKAHVETSRKAAEDKAREQQRQTQMLRSAVFAAARNGDVAAVKNGIWQDAVDAAGGEIRNGCETWVKSPPKDPQETLAHIVANAGERDLFEWLDTHGACYHCLFSPLSSSRRRRGPRGAQFRRPYSISCCSRERTYSNIEVCDRQPPS